MNDSAGRRLLLAAKEGETFDELAARVGVKASTLKMLAAGHRAGPTLDVAIKLEDRLKIGVRTWKQSPGGP